MKVPSFCFVLAIVLAISSSATLFAQEPGHDQKLAEMQSMITNLQAELESLKAVQNSEPVAPTPTEIRTPAQRTTPAEPTLARRSTSAEPTLAPYPSANFPPRQNGNYQPSVNGNFPAAQDGYYPPAQEGYYPPAQGGYYPPAYPQYFGPPTEPVYYAQPPVVMVEPAFCPHAGYCNGYVGRGAELYVGPNGWGLGVGGLQLDFFGYGGGYGRGHGGGHKGHKGH